MLDKLYLLIDLIISLMIHSCPIFFSPPILNGKKEKDIELQKLTNSDTNLFFSLKDSKST